MGGSSVCLKDLGIEVANFQAALESVVIVGEGSCLKAGKTEAQGPGKRYLALNDLEQSITVCRDNELQCLIG